VSPSPMPVSKISQNASTSTSRKGSSGPPSSPFPIKAAPPKNTDPENGQKPKENHKKSKENNPKRPKLRVPGSAWVGPAAMAPVYESYGHRAGHPVPLSGKPWQRALLGLICVIGVVWLVRDLRSKAKPVAHAPIRGPPGPHVCLCPVLPQTGGPGPAQTTPVTHVSTKRQGVSHRTEALTPTHWHRHRSPYSGQEGIDVCGLGEH
jgi:hypothetical protein